MADRIEIRIVGVHLAFDESACVGLAPELAALEVVDDQVLFFGTGDAGGHVEVGLDGHLGQPDAHARDVRLEVAVRAQVLAEEVRAREVDRIHRLYHEVPLVQSAWDLVPVDAVAQQVDTQEFVECVVETHLQVVEVYLNVKIGHIGVS